MAAKVDKMKAALRKPKEEKVVDWEAGLSSGCTLVNLAMTGRTGVAFLPGHCYPLVGDSSSGKTWMLLQVMAEATRNPLFGKYDIILDQPERGALMNISRYFGADLARRLKPPSLGRPSDILEEFYDQVQDAVDGGKPFLYGLDSEDSLPPAADIQKMDEDRAARRKAIDKGDEAADADIKGSYKTDRARTNSSSLRVANNNMAKTGSMLFIIKQTRDRIGFGSQFDPKTKSGGNAITFYATHELWFSVRGDIRKTVRGKSRVIGVRLMVKVKKNRGTGRSRSVELHFYPSLGFDDTGSMCNFLIEEGHWVAKKSTSGDASSVKAPEFDFEGKVETLIETIEGIQDGPKELTRLVADVWRDIEDQCAVNRRPRYT